MNMRAVLRRRFVVLTFAVCSVAHAGPVTFYYSGEITRVHDPNGLLDGQVMVGEAFAGEFTLEADTPDSFPEPRRGEYLNSILATSGVAGGIAFSELAGGSSTIVIDNGHGGTSDSYGYIVEVDLLGLRLDQELFILDKTGTALSSASIPTIPPDLELFSLIVFAIGDTTETYNLSIEGTLSAIVPEPTTLIVLLFSACIAIGRRVTGTRRCRTGKQAPLPRRRPSQYPPRSLKLPRYWLGFSATRGARAGTWPVP